MVDPDRLDNHYQDIIRSMLVISHAIPRLGHPVHSTKAQLEPLILSLHNELLNETDTP